MKVKEQKEIKFINDCNAIVDCEDLSKAILWFSDRKVIPIKHIYMYGKYPAISIHEYKIHIHRLLMMYWLNCKIPREFSVHHINGNRLDCSKANLCIMLNSAHASKHNKNKVISAQTRNLMAIAGHKRKGIKIKNHRRDVTISLIMELKEKGYSINSIARILNCDWSTVRARIRSYQNPELLKEGE